MIVFMNIRVCEYSCLCIANGSVLYFEVLWQQAVNLKQPLSGQRNLVAVDRQIAGILLIGECFLELIQNFDSKLRSESAGIDSALFKLQHNFAY